MSEVRQRSVDDHSQEKFFESFLAYIEATKNKPKLSAEPPARSFPGLNATPLGLCAFALTTFIASMYLCGISVPVDAPIGAVMGVALFYGGVTQFFAGYLAFREGNTFTGVAFCSYGGFWLGFASTFIAAFNFLGEYRNLSVLNNALGMFFLAWGIFTGLMLLACLRTNVITICLFFSLFTCFILLASSKFCQGHQNLQRASGAFGLSAATFAWYSAFAHLVNKMDWFFKCPLFDVTTKKVSEEDNEKPKA